MKETNLRHKAILWFSLFSLLFFLLGVQALSAQTVEKHRLEFKSLLQKNPNYFGTFPGFKLKPVLQLARNTKYEELKCLGFEPQKDLLQAVVQVKLQNGYNTALCKPGSIEYVRVFADWNGNGVFEASEDAGMVSVNVHNILDKPARCLDSFKPLAYALTLKLNPKKFPCEKPNLVQVRAILSWEKEPTAGDPDFNPVWGNVVHQWIQIKPLWLLKLEELKDTFAKEGKIDAEKLQKLEEEEAKPKALTVGELRTLYAGTSVPELRFNVTEIRALAMKVKKEPSLLKQYKLNPKNAQLVKDIQAVLAENPSIKYEALGCLGWQYDLEQLVATLTVKQPSGYSGGLCSPGSQEYVAFWAYIHDPIEQMCHWKYLGTTSVNVHDLGKIPTLGVHYAVSLPADLSRLQSTCDSPGIVKVRAILSWNDAPPMNDPEHKPHWGNKVDAIIQLKPQGGEPGKQVPFISQVGGMPVAGIAGNNQTIFTSALGDGYANGPFVLGGNPAIESPFGRLITVCGRISNPPDVLAPKLKYKVQYKKSTSSTWQDLQNDFWIVLNKTTDGGVNWTQSYYKQTAATGYYEYQVDWDGNSKCLVENEVLGNWQTPVYEGDGLYEVRMLLGGVSSNVIKVMVDNTAPYAAIKWNLATPTDPCTTISGSGMRSGTFTATDTHFYQYTLSVLPEKTASLTPPTVTPLGESYPALPVPGKINGPFDLHTAADTTPCGYVVLLQVWDRAILNNHLTGNYDYESVGMCVLK